MEHDLDLARADRRAACHDVPGFARAYDRAAEADQDGQHAPTVARLLHELRTEFGDELSAAVREHLAIDYCVELPCERCHDDGAACECGAPGGFCSCAPCSACGVP